MLIHRLNLRKIQDINMFIKKRTTIFVLSLLLFQVKGFSQKTILSSPDKSLQISMATGTGIHSLVQYNFLKGKETILKKATISFDINSLKSDIFSLIKTERKTVSSTWKAVYGERKTIPDQYNQITFYFMSAAS